MATIIPNDDSAYLNAIIRIKEGQQQKRYQAIAEQQQARKWGNVDQAVEAMNRQRGVGFLDRMIGDKVADTGFGKLFGFKKPTTAEDFGVRAPGSGLFEPKTAELREVPAMAGSARERVEMAKADAYMKKIGGYSTKGVKEAKDAQQPDYEGTFAPTEGRQLATKADYAAANQEDANRAYNETAQKQADAYNAKIAPLHGNLEGETYQEQMGNLMRRWNSAPSNQREAMRSEFQRAEYELNDRWGRSGKYKSMFEQRGGGGGQSFTIRDKDGVGIEVIDAPTAETAIKMYKQRNPGWKEKYPELLADKVGSTSAGSDIDYKREKDKEVMLSNYGKAKTDKQRAAIKAAFERQYGETIVRTDRSNLFNAVRTNSPWNPFDKTRYEVQPLGGNDVRRVAGKQGPSQATAKPITDDIARKILKEAGNDPQKAAQIAKDRGYTIE